MKHLVGEDSSSFSGELGIGADRLTDAGGVDMSGAPVADKYVVAVHFAMTTMATVGELLSIGYQGLGSEGGAA